MTEMKAAPHNLVDVFKAVYYHLYSNGQASRAERIVEDLTLILLSKLAVERSGRQADLDRVLDGGDPQELVRLVAKAFPAAARDADGFHNDDVAIRHALGALGDVALTGTPAHALGDAFQAVMGPRVRGDKGQFFTPRSLVRAIVEVLRPAPGEAVADPAAGTAGFLVEADTFRGATAEATGQLVAVDKDHDLYRLSTALLGITCGAYAEAHNFNSLDHREWYSRFGSDKELFDVIPTNPPFGSRIGVTDPTLLATYDFGFAWKQSSDGTWQKTEKQLSSQDPGILFLELSVRLLRPGGRLGIVLPEGLFGNRTTGYIWQWLRGAGSIDALLDCPRTTFQPGTDTKTNVLFFTKGKNSGVQTRIAVALTCGHDRRGRTHRADGSPYADDFADLGAAFWRSGQGWWEENLEHRSYLVPRYYERIQPATVAEAKLLQGAERATIGELVASGLLTCRKGHEVGSEAYGTGDVPFVRTSDVSNFEINSDPTKSISEDAYRLYKDTQALRPHDLLMVVDGRYRIGATALLTERNARCVVQSHLRILSVTDLGLERITPFDLLFALGLPSVRRRIRDLVFVQSTLGALGGRLLELEVPLLGGAGPWRARVDGFREVLLARDELLGRLRDSTADTFEL